ncbi:MAG TPA: Uma2 family endonuclease [Lacipirellulaceae bacterium]|jgi:Uma2 family endonuclease
MKAVMSVVPEHILKWRRRVGIDRYDEMWEGVLHMAPSPNREHQDFEGELEFWLRLHWAMPNGCRVYHEINVAEAGMWPDNYRIPDLVLLTPARFDIDRNEYFNGGPDVVVEIRSPDDESYEKFAFYSKVGVCEVWVLDRDTRQPEIFELTGDGYESLRPAGDGWVRSQVVGCEMRTAADGRLEIRLVDRTDTLARIPSMV